MIKTYVALSALIVALFILLLVISPYGEYQQTNTGTGYECYGWECVDPYPTEPSNDWGGTSWNSCNISSLKYYDYCSI